MVGVERGPSPPLLSLVPLLPPLSYFATARSVAQSSLPVLASRATQTSRSAPSMVRLTSVNALPLLTVMELKPPVRGVLQRRRGPSGGQTAAICSGLVLS